MRSGAENANPAKVNTKQQAMPSVKARTAGNHAGYSVTKVNSKFRAWE